MGGERRLCARDLAERHIVLIINHAGLGWQANGGHARPPAVLGRSGEAGARHRPRPGLVIDSWDAARRFRPWRPAKGEVTLRTGTAVISFTRTGRPIVKETRPAWKRRNQG
jgi:hypothetical protein